MLSLHFPPRDDNEILTKICKIKILKHKNFIEIAKQNAKFKFRILGESTPMVVEKLLKIV